MTSTDQPDELTQSQWFTNPTPRHISFPAHGHSVVTCLIFADIGRASPEDNKKGSKPRKRIISASDDHSIHVYSPYTGAHEMYLEGHEGGIWSVGAVDGLLVSGSTDRTVRIWDLSDSEPQSQTATETKKVKCLHVFEGHTSTVRCLEIVKPELVDVGGRFGGDGPERKETWPKQTLIVTGSRDHSLRAWTLPKRGDPEFKSSGSDKGEEDGDSPSINPEDNPYHLFHLEGHDHAVRALAAHGRTVVSGSYDCTGRIWDIATGQCRFVLTGHTQKVYSVVYDPTRHITATGSMDGTVRVWSTLTGKSLHVLTGHTSLVGLLGMSPSYLVSAAADSTLRIWDVEKGECKAVLAAHTGAITCFQLDETKVLSGSDGTLKLWDLREAASIGEVSSMKNLLTGITGVWQVAFDGTWLAAASNKNDQTMLDIWDFAKTDGDVDPGAGNGGGEV
ncbi:SCF ubiquitin ligase complex subunit cdc4 [Marasmius tenuissimus]|nr:SCF ubiquitin ligase complex subunit cdc4 [Marasmius tenuissimus]